MNEQIVRDYEDINSFKDLAINEITPAYFPDVDSENLTETGTIGMLTELVGTITEDAFNTGSSLVAEAFPTRAKMASSIYANAAIFQLGNLFGSAARCNIILAIPEQDIRNNFQRIDTSEFYYFYLDKNTTIKVEGLIFTLDYDVEIRAQYRETEKGWVYSAKYIMDEGKNTASPITDPYVRLKKHKNGLLAIYLEVGQYERTILYEGIVDNATLNYPTVKVRYDDILVGFDIYYKGPKDSDYNTQLEAKVIYSIPSKNPFSYYKSIDEHTVQLSFTTKDAYFQPEFNSELKIVVYSTQGSAGNFKQYTGQSIEIVKGDAYDYENSWLLTGRVLGDAVGGADRLSLEGLQRLTVEGFTTANAIDTENDLHVYFSNFKYRYYNSVLFTKKRNDAVELLFSAFMFIQKDDYIYPTNTLNLDTNVLELEEKEGGFYNIDPGYLFGYKQDDAFFIPIKYVIRGGDGEYYDKDGHYFEPDGTADPARDISAIKVTRMVREKTLAPTDASYWYRDAANSSNWVLYHSDGTVYEDSETLTTEEMYASFKSGEVTYGMQEVSSYDIDFIKDEEKEIDAKLAYMNYYETYKEEQENPDMTYSEYLFNYSFKQYKIDHKIDNRIRIFDVDFENFPYARSFMFTNPFIITIMKDVNLVSYYQSFISQDAILDFEKENDDDAFVQFITYTLHMNRDVAKEKRYEMELRFTPSTTQTEEYPYCEWFYDEEDPTKYNLYEGGPGPSLSNFDRSNLTKNRLRVVVSFYSLGTMVGYYEMIPVSYDLVLDQYVFRGEFYTDDYITSDNRFRIIHYCPYCGHEVLNSENYEQESKKYFCPECGKYFDDGIINVLESDTILLPISDLYVTVTVLFNDPENEGGTVTNNAFVEYDEAFVGYQWTNLYSTLSNPLTMIQPLDMVRSTIRYKDYYIAGNSKLDCVVESMPVLKYSILAYKDNGMTVTDPLLSDDIGKFQYFMDQYLSNYEILKSAKKRMGGMNIDAKFYNTYGKSTNFIIGDDTPIDTNNIRLYMDIYLYAGVDQVEIDRQLKNFIQDFVQNVNETGTNNFYISNLLREIERNFAQVNHIRFHKINDYPTTYQSVENTKIDLENLTKEERRTFVPDLLVINKNNIFLTYFQDEL